MSVEIFLPKMSDHMERGTIIRWLVMEGQPVKKGDLLLELETDKAVGELEAPADGILYAVRYQDGSEVSVGEVIAYILQPGEKPADMVPETPLAAPLAAPPNPSPTQPAHIHSDSVIIPATPAARRVARELHVDLRSVKGSGPGGRVTETDIHIYAKNIQGNIPDALVANSDQFIDLNTIQLQTGRLMLHSAQTIPQFSLQVDAIADPLLQAQTSQQVSITALLVFILGKTLRQHPRLNASYEEGRIRLFGQVNIGVAVGTRDGLFVPVIHFVDEKSLTEIHSILQIFQQKAAQKRFVPAELEGGTFTLSNLGMHGVDAFRAIVNPPQSAILATGRIRRALVVDDGGSMATRALITLTLSADHRSLDGILAAQFLSAVQKAIECFEG